jgi:hypothetical protein
MLGKVYRAPNEGVVCTGNSGAGFKRDLIDAIDEEGIQARVRRVEKEKIRGRRDGKLNQFRVRWKRREREGEEDECKWQMTNDVEQKAFFQKAYERHTGCLRKTQSRFDIASFAFVSRFVPYL